MSFVLDVTSTSHLTSLVVPESVLDEGTTYYWRVMFCDNNNDESEWSDPYSFTTLTTSDDTDSNSDGGGGCFISILSYGAHDRNEALKLDRIKRSGRRNVENCTTVLRPKFSP